MRWKIGLMLGVVACLNVMAMGQNAAVPTQSPPAADGIETRLVAKLSGGGALKTVLKQLKDAVPELNIVVSQDAGAEEPIMPLWDVKNVSVEQVFNLIQATCPSVQIQRIEGQGPPLILVHITQQYPPFPAPNQANPQAAAAPPLFVYRLTTIITSLAANKPAGKDARNQAMNDVMSLLQSALDQVRHESGQSKMEVHPPTEMLIFKGTPEQIMALQQVLTALEPTANEETAKKLNEQLDSDRLRFGEAKIEWMRTQQNLASQLDDTRKQLEQARMQMMEMKVQMQAEADARLRAEQQRAATRPRE